MSAKLSFGYLLYFPSIFVVVFNSLELINSDFRFCDDIKYMTGKHPPYVFRIMWKYVSPFFLLIMLVMSFYQMCAETPMYEVRDKSKFILPVSVAWWDSCGDSVTRKNSVGKWSTALRDPSCFCSFFLLFLYNTYIYWARC